jgi:hypothetical protein
MRQRLVERGSGHRSEQIAADIEPERRQSGLPADVSSRVHGRLLDRLRIDALQLVWRDRVKHDSQAEVSL